MKSMNRGVAAVTLFILVPGAGHHRVFDSGGAVLYQVAAVAVLGAVICTMQVILNDTMMDNDVN